MSFPFSLILKELLQLLSTKRKYKIYDPSYTLPTVVRLGEDSSPFPQNTLLTTRTRPDEEEKNFLQLSQLGPRKKLPVSLFVL